MTPYIDLVIDELAALAGRELSRTERRIDGELKRLREERAELRCELNALSASNLTPMRGNGRDAA